MAKININEHILPFFLINFINILVKTIKYKESFNSNFSKNLMSDLFFLLFFYFIQLAKDIKMKTKQKHDELPGSTKSTKEHYHRKVQCSQLSRTRQIIIMIKEKLHAANQKCYNYKK